MRSRFESFVDFSTSPFGNSLQHLVFFVVLYYYRSRFVHCWHHANSLYLNAPKKKQKHVPRRLLELMPNEPTTPRVIAVAVVVVVVAENDDVDEFAAAAAAATRLAARRRACAIGVGFKLEPAEAAVVAAAAAAAPARCCCCKGRCAALLRIERTREKEKKILPPPVHLERVSLLFLYAGGGERRDVLSLSVLLAR